jgi:cytochrome c
VTAPLSSVARLAAPAALVAALAAWPATAMAADTRHVKTLLSKYRCDLCHAEREPGAGPTYVEIAAHYRNDPRALATLTAVVRRGEHGGGPWNMPPHPEASEREARAMVRYILSVKE